MGSIMVTERFYIGKQVVSEEKKADIELDIKELPEVNEIELTGEAMLSDFGVLTDD